MPNATHLPQPPPVQTFARCINDEKQPADFVGDWPIKGAVYEVQVKPHRHTLAPQVHVLGFYAERPYGAFAIHRFTLVAEVWLN